MVNKYHKSAREYMQDMQIGILTKKLKAKKGGRRIAQPPRDRNYTGK